MKHKTSEFYLELYQIVDNKKKRDDIEQKFIGFFQPFVFSSTVLRVTYRVSPRFTGSRTGASILEVLRS